MNNFKNEIWKDVIVDKEEINKYKGLYQVSNLGRVKSFTRKSEKILTPGISEKGYKQVALCKDGEIKQYKVHRLVLLAFDYNNYFDGAEVNHKDENPSNNSLKNIEWCDARYNCNYGKHCENISKSNVGRKLTKEQCKKISARMCGKYMGKSNPAYNTHTNGRDIICLNNLVVYPSSRQASKDLNSDNSTITKICKGKKKSIHGYKFMYYSDFLKQVNTEITMENKKSIAS